MKKQTTSIEETTQIAIDLASELKGGEVLALDGDLGSGKTTFTQGLARGLGIKDNVSSPTFVLMKVYPVNHASIKQLVHVDTYRLKTPEELLAIGLADYLGRSDTVVVIEWAEKIRSILPDQTRHIKFSHQDETSRLIEF